MGTSNGRLKEECKMEEREKVCYLYSEWHSKSRKFKCRLKIGLHIMVLSPANLVDFSRVTIVSLEANCSHVHKLLGNFSATFGSFGNFQLVVLPKDYV